MLCLWMTAVSLRLERRIQQVGIRQVGSTAASSGLTNVLVIFRARLDERRAQLLRERLALRYSHPSTLISDRT